MMLKQTKAEFAALFTVAPPPAKPKHVKALTRKQRRRAAMKQEKTK